MPMPNSPNIFKAMLFQHPDEIPVGIGILPIAWMKHREKMDVILLRHPSLFPDHQVGKQDYDSVSGKYVAGEHIDAWGCVWSSIITGHDSIVTGHPVPNREDIHKLKPPTTDDGFPHGFMFLRLTDLRGFEEAMYDFAEEPPELQMMLDVVLEHNMRQGKLLLDRLNQQDEPQIVWFGDDLGTQHALPISPEKWRKYLKPCFKAIYEPFKKAGHYVHMHTDGHINEIIMDLKDCGVDCVNPQSRACGIDELAKICKGKICVNIDLDRQMFPFATPEQIDEHVKHAVTALGSKEGGLWINFEIDDEIPLENVEAVLSSIEKYRLFYS
jgi:hypothetical protein